MESQPQSENNSGLRKVVIVGEMGMGKSSFCRSLTNMTIFRVSADSKPCTTKTQYFKV